MSNRKRRMPSDGGCWFCCTAEESDWDLMFDTYVHQSCIQAALYRDPTHAEARFMRYLLPQQDDGGVV